MISIGRNRNSNDTAAVSGPITVSAGTAVILSPANPNRIYFQVNLLPGAADVCVFIRLYPAAADNLANGDWIGRYNQGNDVFFLPFWRMMQDNIYTGEISAILMPGDLPENLYITEY